MNRKDSRPTGEGGIGVHAEIDHCGHRRHFIFSLLLPVLLFEQSPEVARAQRTAQPDFPTIPSPTVLIEIKFKPGTASTWEKAFREELVPSLREAVHRGDDVTGFEYYETVNPERVYDFVLVVSVKTFGPFDESQQRSHYQALFRRLGQQPAQHVLDMMSSCEETVTITRLRGYTEHNSWGLRH